MTDSIKWRCEGCGLVSSLSELMKDYIRGGYRGEPHYTCPNCGSDELEDMYQCSLCGDWLPGDDLHGYADQLVCDRCLAEHTTLEEAADFGATCPEEVEINGLVTKMFSPEEINQILMDALKGMEQDDTDSCVTDYIAENKSEFAEYLATL